MKWIFLVLVFVTGCLNLHAQNWDWVEGVSGATNSYCTGIASDNMGNEYIAGSFSGPAISFRNLTLYNSSDSGLYLQGFIVKFDSDGNALWGNVIGTDTAQTQCLGVASDIDGNVLITGYLDFEVHNTYNGYGYYFTNNIFIAKYSPSGDLLWMRTAVANSGYDDGNCITTDKQGNIYVSGVWYDNSLAFGNDTLQNNGYSNMFLVKYSPDGEALWAVGYGGDTYDDITNSVSADSAGNVFVTGGFVSDYINIDGVWLGNSDTSNSSSSWSDFFVARFNTYGKLSWAQGAGGTGSSLGSGVATDGTGNAYITGSFISPTIDFGGIVNDWGPFFIVKYDSSGKVIWVKSMRGSYILGNNLCVDANDNIYVTGDYSGTSSFDGQALPGTGGIFVAKFDSSGNVIWVNSAAGGAYTNVAVDKGSVYLAGEFNSAQLIFDSTSLDGPAGTANSTQQIYTVYIAKIDKYGHAHILSIGPIINTLIYPNPNNGIFNLETYNIYDPAVKIFNSIGQIVYETVLTSSTIDLSNFANGIYFVQVTGGGRVNNAKLLIQR